MRLQLSLQWLLSVFAALIAWSLVLISRLQEPVRITLVTWMPQELLRFSPELITDDTAWAFSLAVSGLAFSALLIDAVRLTAPAYKNPTWIEWTTVLLFCSASILAASAGNLLTLLMIWIVIDVLELFTRMSAAENRSESERILLNFSFHLAGLFLVFWVLATSSPSTEPSQLFQFTRRSYILLFLAALLRLISFPGYLPGENRKDQHTGIKLAQQILPVSATLVLLVRLSQSSISFVLSTPLLIISLLVTIFYGVLWLFTKNRFLSIQYWTVGLGIFTILAAILSKPSAAGAYSIILIINGGFFCLYSFHRKLLLPVLLLSVFGLLLIPLTPGWQAVLLYEKPNTFLIYGFIFSFGLYIVGFIYNSINRALPLPQVERWVWIIYPAGLIFLPFTHYLILISNIIFRNRLNILFPDLVTSLPGLISLLCGFLIFLFLQRGYSLPSNIFQPMEKIARLDWFQMIIRKFYTALARTTWFINRLLEGQGGLLWSLLLLTLIISVLAQIKLVK